MKQLLAAFNRLPAWLQLTCGAVLISFSGVYVKIAHVTPVVAGFYRMLFGGIALLILGLAAFLGAGYRTPIAAVMFVAETTGKPNFVVPALIAAVAAELVMGEQSITAFQRRPGQD